MFWVFPKKNKKTAAKRLPFFMYRLVGVEPLVDLGLGQAQDVLSGVGRSLAAANMQEIQTAGSLVQILLITGRIAIGTEAVSLDQGSGLGIIFLLANDLLHGTNLLSFVSNGVYYIDYF